jgi:hypothetical protein
MLSSLGRDEGLLSQGTWPRWVPRYRPIPAIPSRVVTSFVKRNAQQIDLHLGPHFSRCLMLEHRSVLSSIGFSPVHPPSHDCGHDGRQPQHVADRKSEHGAQT